MKLFEFCGLTHFEGVGFRVGRSKIVWESATYRNSDKVVISRVLEQGDTRGKPFLTGLRYQSRRASPDAEITLVYDEEK